MKMKVGRILKQTLPKSEVKVENGFVTFKIDSFMEKGLQSGDFRLRVEVINVDSNEIWGTVNNSDYRHLFSGMKEIKGEKGFIRESACKKFTVGENDKLNTHHGKDICEKCLAMNKRTINDD